MGRVQLEAAGWAFAGSAFAVIVLAVHGQTVPPLSAGWLATLAYLLLSNVLLVRGLRRRRSERLGPANIITMTRSTLVGLITGLVVASFTTTIAVVLLVALVIPALALDAVDGWVARRTGTTTELGARFDMEVDAFLLLVLSVYVAQSSGVWVLAIGSMRYAFVIVGWALPWFRRKLPPRYWRKVVTAVAGIALAAAASGILRPVGIVFVAAALVLLIESFGRDVVWLVHRRRDVAAAPPLVEAKAENVE
ncbi:MULTISPECIES: CDP-alcohol phosphatidyltransferase family protein [unclassified Leifsonia]|uniref:CDP-alcohol phosphatidyltransferase family protein n=1 Tax=unclassified Leifsonia TaxID=2663824 RepID=UPI0008A8117F|nr:MULTISPECIES: CDP-alcohol phosphatidyltransferase family protein [unclassified Leifsonia]SEI13297.1 Phosphatidylglycerophosphate synthase [Leifsonia sp. CL154]SFL98589.1 Phosphatidylglycerophosphate synthase [Leifsonia sp. CL147]